MRSTLSEAGISVLDCEHKTPAAQPTGFPYLAIPDVRDGRIDTTQSRLISEGDLATWTRKTVPRGGDILVTRRGRVGDTAPIPEGLRCAIGQNLVLLRSDGSSVHQPYLRWAVRSPQWWSEVERLTNVGAVFSSLNVRDIARISLDFPGLVEQQAIADVLGALDDKVAANLELAAVAERLASAVYDDAASTWSRVAMNEVLTPILGGTPMRSRDDYWGDGDQCWVSVRDITTAPFGVVTDTAEKITSRAESETRAKALPAGSVILTARGTVGQVGRLAVRASFNQSCYGFASETMPPGVLYYSILRATERAKAMAHGSVFATITTSTFDHLEIPWERDSAHAVEKSINPLLEKQVSALRENRLLAATRDALLPQLMSGKLRVRDAERIASDAGL